MPMPRRLVFILLAGCCVFSVAAQDTPTPSVQADPGARFGLVFGEPPVLQDLGADWSRSDFTWAGFERTPGQFDFGGMIERVAAFDAAGKHILPILDYAPAWDPERAPADPATLDQWANYVDKTVRQFRGSLKYWQVWNEPNLGGFWKPKADPEAYAALLRRSYETIKKIDPDLQVIGVNTSDIDLAFAERVFQAGGLQYMDIVAVQPYRLAPEVGHFEEVAALRALMQRYGEVKPIWFTEMGNDSRHFPFKDSGDYFADRPCRRQSAFLVRYMTIIQAAGIQKVFWFAQTAEGASLIDQITGKPRPAYHAYQHLISSIGAFQEVHPCVPPGAHGLHAYLFTLPERAVLIAWSVRGPQDLQFRTRVTGELRDMFGESIPFEGGTTLSLDEEPKFLFLENPEAVSEATALDIAPPQLWLEPGTEQDLSIAPVTPDLAAPRLTIDPPKGIRVGPSKVNLDAGPAIVPVTAKDHAHPAIGRLRVKSKTNEWPVEINITPKLRWTFRASTGNMTPAVFQAEEDSVLLVPSFESNDLVALSLDGRELWRYAAGGRINDTVVTGNIAGDAQPEIVGAAPGQQLIFALDAKGAPLWRVRLDESEAERPLVQDTGKPVETLENPAWRWTHPVLGDLDGDGLAEILYADRRGVLSVLDGVGNLLWSRTVSQQRCDLPLCLAELNAVPGPEILCADKSGVIHCLDSAGNVLWSVAVGGAIESPLVSAILEPRGAPLVLAGTRAEEIVCLNAAGEVLWRAQLGGTMDLGAGIAIGDIDGDGDQEVVATTRNHRVLAFDHTGSRLWQFEAGAQFRTTPVLYDIDQDGAAEIFAAPSDWRAYCLAGDGTLLWSLNTGHRTDSDPVVVEQPSGATLISTTREGAVTAWKLN